MKKRKIKVEEHLGMKFGVSERCLGGEKPQISQERLKRIDLKLRGTYIQKLHKARSIDSYQALKRRVLAIELAIKDLTRGFLNNEARWIEVTIQQLSRRQKVSRWIELAIESCQVLITQELMYQNSNVWQTMIKTGCLVLFRLAQNCVFYVKLESS